MIRFLGTFRDSMGRGYSATLSGCDLTVAHLYPDMSPATDEGTLWRLRVAEGTDDAAALAAALDTVERAGYSWPSDALIDPA